ncbi:hypothetical protein BV20DRAFT_72055 [Pilatotrama ljubarskyi]|nr:hypothetical protein BV20DRAFT_72055 [Pilatotrama ljubarskyi]
MGKTPLRTAVTRHACPVRDARNRGWRDWPASIPSTPGPIILSADKMPFETQPFPPRGPTSIVEDTSSSITVITPSAVSTTSSENTGTTEVPSSTIPQVTNTRTASTNSNDSTSDSEDDDDTQASSQPSTSIATTPTSVSASGGGSPANTRSLSIVIILLSVLVVLLVVVIAVLVRRRNIRA